MLIPPVSTRGRHCPRELGLDDDGDGGERQGNVKGLVIGTLGRALCKSAWSITKTRSCRFGEEPGAKSDQVGRPCEGRVGAFSVTVTVGSTGSIIAALSQRSSSVNGAEMRTLICKRTGIDATDGSRVPLLKSFSLIR